MTLIDVINLYAICMVKNYFAHIRPLKQVLDNGLTLEKMGKVIQVNQEHAWEYIEGLFFLSPYAIIDYDF